MIPVGLRMCEFGLMRKGVVIFPKKMDTTLAELRAGWRPNMRFRTVTR